MKAVRLVEIGKPLQEQEIPLPPVGDRDVLVRVAAAGICHSDVHYRAGSSPVGVLPQTLGHEVAGTIDQKAVNSPLDKVRNTKKTAHLLGHVKTVKKDHHGLSGRLIGGCFHK